MAAPGLLPVLRAKAAGLPAVCIEARHAKAAMVAMTRNKNDRNDAQSLAIVLEPMAHHGLPHTSFIDKPLTGVGCMIDRTFHLDR